MFNGKALKKLFENKKMVYILIASVLVGIILLLSDTGTTSYKKNPETEYINKGVSDNTVQNKSVKSEIENILSSIDGLGETKVWITHAAQQKHRESLFGEASYDSGYENDNDEITGLIIVAEGGDNENITYEIAQALSEVIGIPRHKVKFFKMK